jgi:hypothetical protein
VDLDSSWFMSSRTYVLLTVVISKPTHPIPAFTHSSRTMTVQFTLSVPATPSLPTYYSPPKPPPLLPHKLKKMRHIDQIVPSCFEFTKTVTEAREESQFPSISHTPCVTVLILSLSCFCLHSLMCLSVRQESASQST